MTITSTRLGSPISAKPQSSGSIRDRYGIGFGTGPLFVLVGIAFLMVTTPGLFNWIASLPAAGTWQADALGAVRTWAHDLATWVASPNLANLDVVFVTAALLAMPALVVASLLRSARARTWQPTLITVFACLAGVIAIPAITWAGEVAVVVWRWAGIIGAAIVRFIAWAAPVLVVIGLVIGALVVLSWLVMLIILITEAKKWPTVIVLGLMAAAIAGAIYLGWLDGVLAWLSHVVQVLAHWLATYIGPVIAWIVQAIVFLVFLLLFIGFGIAFFGQVGWTVVRPVTSAGGSGRDQGKCADVAAGVGVAFSLMLTAAVTNPGFGAWFEQIWSDTPVVHLVGSPVGVFDFLLPSAAEGILRPAFVGYVPLIDAALLVLVAAIGIVSLVFSPGRWSKEYGSRIAVPVMLAVGLAIAIALPLLLLALWIGSQADS